jgi:hypothetical protein
VPAVTVAAKMFNPNCNLGHKGIFVYIFLSIIFHFSTPKKDFLILFHSFSFSMGNKHPTKERKGREKVSQEKLFFLGAFCEKGTHPFVFLLFLTSALNLSSHSLSLSHLRSFTPIHTHTHDNIYRCKLFSPLFFWCTLHSRNFVVFLEKEEKKSEKCRCVSSVCAHILHRIASKK